MSVTLVTILMMGVFLTGFLLLWQGFNRNAIAISDAIRISAESEREKSRSALDIESVTVATEACAIDVGTVNAGLDPIAPVSEIGVIVGFPRSTHDSRMLVYKNDDALNPDTWSVKSSYPGEIEPVMIHPGTSRVLRLVLDLPDPGPTSAVLFLSTPNGVTTTASVNEIGTACSTSG